VWLLGLLVLGSVSAGREKDTEPGVYPPPPPQTKDGVVGGTVPVPPVP